MNLDKLPFVLGYLSLHPKAAKHFHFAVITFCLVLLGCVDESDDGCLLEKGYFFFEGKHSIHPVIELIYYLHP